MRSGRCGAARSAAGANPSCLPLSASLVGFQVPRHDLRSSVAPVPHRFTMMRLARPPPTGLFTLLTGSRLTPAGNGFLQRSVLCLAAPRTGEQAGAYVCACQLDGVHGCMAWTMAAWPSTDMATTCLPPACCAHIYPSSHQSHLPHRTSPGKQHWQQELWAHKQRQRG